MTTTRFDDVLLRHKRNRLLDLGFAVMVAVGVSLGAAGAASATDHARAAAPASALPPSVDAAAEFSVARGTLEQLALRERLGR